MRPDRRGPATLQHQVNYKLGYSLAILRYLIAGGSFLVGKGCTTSPAVLVLAIIGRRFSILSFDSRCFKSGHADRLHRPVLVITSDLAAGNLAVYFINTD